MTGTADPARRFYKAAQAAAEDGGFGVKLDGRTPRTPAGGRLVLPTAGLAELVAAEWAAQGELILPTTMPATRLAFTALDRVAGAREAVAQEVARIAGSDLLCYFAEQPAALASRQAQRWGPLLDWAHERLGVRLERAVGIVHQPQTPAALARVEALALEEGDFALTALAHAAALLGSAVLALALRRGRVDGEEAFALSQLDEHYQAEHWGVDEEAAERADGLKSETLLLERWFRALG